MLYWQLQIAFDLVNNEHQAIYAERNVIKILKEMSPTQIQRKLFMLIDYQK